MSKTATLTNYVDCNDNVHEVNLRIFKENKLKYNKSFVNDGTMDIDELSDLVVDICKNFGVKQLNSTKCNIWKEWK